MGQYTGLQEADELFEVNDSASAGTPVDNSAKTATIARIFLAISRNFIGPRPHNNTPNPGGDTTVR
jgi:hypothetical protein